MGKRERTHAIEIMHPARMAPRVSGMLKPGIIAVVNAWTSSIAGTQHDSENDQRQTRSSCKQSRGEELKGWGEQNRTGTHGGRSFKALRAEGRPGSVIRLVGAYSASVRPERA